MGLSDTYRKSLIAFWNYTHNIRLQAEHILTEEELLTVTPTQLYAFFAYKAYGIPNPNEHDNPTFGRSSSIEFHKKAISFFMPNRLAHWDARTSTGNPTKSVEVNNLIKAVKKKEVRKQGIPSQARRPMQLSEFKEIIKRCRNNSSPFIKYTASAYFIFQFHLIGRLDDVANFSHEDLTPHGEFDFALKSKMCWSKNVLEERGAPDQIILGAKDPYFCTILALAIHFEFSIRSGVVGQATKMFNTQKHRISILLKSIVDNESFPLSDSGPIGTHSIRKLPATYARNNGCDRDDVEARGRWKTQRRIVDTYISTSLPYPDTKVAAVLAIGGAVKYKVKPDSRISDNFILEKVVPSTNTIKNRKTSLILGTALLWAVFDQELSRILDPTYVEGVQQAYNELGSTLQPGENPVTKVLLQISGHGGSLYITEIVNVTEGNENERNIGTNNEVEIRALISQICQLQRQNSSLENELNIFKATTTDLLAKINSSLKRLANAPIMTPRVRHPSLMDEQRFQENITTQREALIALRATLCKRPKSLYVLWQEFELGIAGRKAAKEFTSLERGRCRFTYSLRKPFWDLVSSMVRHGYTHNTAIDKIYAVYPSQNVTEILRKIRTDRKNGGHPELRGFVN